MASDPLDLLQSMFPTIDGDVIAIVFSESDKDVTSTVEKLLQLVPIDESEREFPSLQSTVQRLQPRVHSSYQTKSSNHQPDRSSSGPAATSNSGLMSQQGNRRLQGPTHIPPAVNKAQQLKNLTGNEGGGRILSGMTGVGHGSVMPDNVPQQRVQQMPYQQTHHQSKAYGQTNLGKGTAPGNQRRAGGGGTNVASVHNDNVALHGQTSQQKLPQSVQGGGGGGFYQLGGSTVNSVPALNTLEPSSYFYHQALQPPQPTQQQRTTASLQQQQAAQQQLQHQYQRQAAQSHSHSQFQPQSHSQAQYQAQQQHAQRMRTGVIGNGMYGYSGMRPNDPFLASWMNSSRQSDFSNSTNTKNSQFYAALQRPGQHQNWPNSIGGGGGGGIAAAGGGGKATHLQQYQQYQQEQHKVKTQNPNPVPPPYGSAGGYPLQAPVTNISLLGGQTDKSHKHGWPMYSTGAGGVSNATTSGGGGAGNANERGKMDPLSVLLQPERAMSASSSQLSDFGRYGHVQSEPSLSKLQATATAVTGVHYGHTSTSNRGDVPGNNNKVDPHGRKPGVIGGTSSASGGGGGTGSVTHAHSGKGSGGSEVKGVDSGSKKLIILRGLPGSGKTTLARSLVGSGGVICCTDDFFTKNGEYVFDPSLLEENHEKNKCKARDAMKAGRSPVIIDNTNTNAWEMKPYVLLAMEHGYAVEILEPDTPWRFKTAELARRNSHGVPRHTLEKMLERYDHRVTLETIIISQQPERRPPVPKPTDLEPLRSASGGSGGQSANTGGQHKVGGGGGGGRTAKISPPTPRQQHGGGANNETDHTHSSKQQNHSSQLSPRPGRRDQRSNDSGGGGGRVSPRPANQRGQRSSKDNSASSATTGRSGNEQYHQHHQNHQFMTSGTSEGGATSHVSVIGEGRPSSSDARKKTTPLSSNQQQHQSSHPSQTASTMSSSSASSNKSQNDQFSRAKGRGRTTTQQQQQQLQQTGSKSTLSTTANKKRSVSPSSRGPSTSSKQNSQSVGGRENGHHRHQHSEKTNGYVGQKRNTGGEGGKRSRKGTEEDMDDEFLWDSSEETEILDASERGGGGGGRDEGEGDSSDGMRNGPVFMTDEPPKNASFRPVPQVGKAAVMVNGGGICVSTGEGKRVPVFEVWKDSDDEDIDDTNEGEGQGEEESPLPVHWGQKGHSGQQQILQRTLEVANISDKTSVNMFESSASTLKVGVVQAPPSHPWERTQSARDLQEVNDHFTSLIRRVQSVNPMKPLSTLSESESSRSVVNISDENFNVFTMSSIWGSQSGLLGSKMQLTFGNDDDDAEMKSRKERIDSVIKSYWSLQNSNSDSSDCQLERQKKAQSFYSMLDALTEELPAAADKAQDKEKEVNDRKTRGTDSFGKEEVRVGVQSKLLDEAVKSTQNSLTVQEAIEDEAKYPLRNKLIEELLTENVSVRGENTCESKQTVQRMMDSASDLLDTQVDIETLLPEYLSESDISRGDLPPPVKTEASVVDSNGTSLKGAMVSFLADFNVEEGCNLEAFTDKVFTEERLNPEHNFSTLQASFRAFAQKVILKRPPSPSLFVKVGNARQEERERESRETSTDSTFEDPAIVSKICLEGTSDMKLKKLPASKEGIGMKRPALLEGEDKKPSFSVSSPEQLEPLDVFPSAFDEGLAANFPLSVTAATCTSNETADQSQSTSLEQTVEPNSSPLQSQTPVNESMEPEIHVSDADNIGDDSNGGGNDNAGGRRGQEEVNLEPLSAETDTDKPANEGISAEDSALTLTTTSEPSLEGYYLDWNTPPCMDNLTTSTWESDLLFLVECFPDLESNYLSTLLKMCKGSLEGAISTILVSHSSLINGPMEDQSFMHFDSQLSMDTTDDASSTISSASYSELYSHTHAGFGGSQQIDSSPEQQTTTSTTTIHVQPSTGDQVQSDRQKAIFSIGGDENDDVMGDTYEHEQRVLVPFFDEPECVNDEEIARTLQEELNLEASSNQLQSLEQEEEEEATGGGDDGGVGDRNVETAAVVGGRGRSSSHGSEDAMGKTHPSTGGGGDENLELRLSASLARQLQEMFGPVTDKLPFEGEICEEDLVVLLSERAALEIYKKWLDTLHAKRIGYRVQSEIDMTRDEALARRLQKEEDSKAGKHHRKKHHKFRHLTEPSSLAVIATENYRAHHNSSPPQWKGALGTSPQTGGGLADIMGEQMAQQVQEAEVAQVVKDKSEPNLSLKLQLKALYSQFPSLEQPLVNQTLVKNKFDIESTVAELEQILLHPPPPPLSSSSSSSPSQRDSIDGGGFSKAVTTPGQSRSPASKDAKSGGGGGGGHGSIASRSPAKRRLFKSEGKEQKQDGQKGLPAAAEHQAMDDNLLYLELRAEAALHAKLRAENFMKAAHARSKKQYEVAQYYAQQGHLHTEKMKEANQRAADATLKHNFTSSDQLDLHGLHVDEAITALEEKLNSCKGSKLRVVTGRGIHSKGGKGARIRPAVINYLKEKKFNATCEERNPGVLNVRLK